MNLPDTIQTNRLLLTALSLNDDALILELVNTEGWLKFIGDRKVGNLTDAQAYIQNKIDSPHVHYWTVKLSEDHHPIGVVTYIKKEYLDYPDIGFAFLPAYGGLGYAYEASRALLNQAITTTPSVCATTVPENSKSIALLLKLGFEYQREIDAAGTQLSLYTLSTDKVQISLLIQKFFGVFDNRDGKPVQIDSLRFMCSPGMLINKMAEVKLETYAVDAFISSRQKIFDEGSLTDFHETETSSQTKVFGNIAQHSSAYTKSWQHGGNTFRQNGVKLFQLMKEKGQWLICAIIWEDKAVIKQNPKPK